MVSLALRALPPRSLVRVDSTHRVLDVVRGGLVRVDGLDRLFKILGQAVHGLVRDIVVLAVGQLAVRQCDLGVSLGRGGPDLGGY